jgi:hypothetical protein
VGPTSNEANLPAEAGYNVLIIRWHKSADAFNPVDTITAVAEDHGYRVKSTVARKSGRFSIRIDTEASAKGGKRRKPELVSRETARAAAKLFRAAMRDPRLAPTIAALATRSQAGEDVSAELLKVVTETQASSQTVSS